MKAKVELVLRCKDVRTRKSLASVLAPDNEGGPRGLHLSVKGEGTVLKIDIEAGSPATSLTTCLAFLRDVTLFQEVWLLSQPTRG